MLVSALSCRAGPLLLEEPPIERVLNKPQAHDALLREILVNHPRNIAAEVDLPDIPARRWNGRQARSGNGQRNADDVQHNVACACGGQRIAPARCHIRHAAYAKHA